MKSRRFAPLFTALIIFGALAACARPAPTPWNGDLHSHPTLICIRAHESDRGDAGGQGLHDQGYGANNGSHYGAYQFDMNTWSGAAVRAGYPYGVPYYAPLWDPPNGVTNVNPDIQDAVAWQLLQERGTQPWTGSGC